MVKCDQFIQINTDLVSSGLSRVWIFVAVCFLAVDNKMMHINNNGWLLEKGT
jgi:hypothetical protein